MAAPSVGRRFCAGQREAAALSTQSRRRSYGRVKRAAVRWLFSLPSSGRHILYYDAKFNISSTRDKIAIIKMLHFICQSYEAI